MNTLFRHLRVAVLSMLAVVAITVAVAPQMVAAQDAKNTETVEETTEATDESGEESSHAEADDAEDGNDSDMDESYIDTTGLGGFVFYFTDFANINEAINDDILAFASSVNVTQPVNGDIFSGANDITIAAPVTGDVRVAGSIITISENVEGNVVAFGNSITIQDNVTITGDVTLFGNTVNVNGNVTGSGRLGAANAILNGEFGEDVEADVQNLTVGDNAVLNGNTTVYSSSEPDVAENAKGKKRIIHQEQRVDAESTRHNEQMTGGYLWYHIAQAVVWFIVFTVIGGLMILIAPEWTNRAVKAGLEEQGMSWLKGVAFVFGVPGICIVLLFTIIGIPISMLTMMLWGVIIFLGRTVAAMWLGNLFLNKEHKGLDRNTQLLYFVAGNAVASIVYAIPWVGMFFSIAAMVLGTGAMAHTFQKRK